MISALIIGSGAAAAGTALALSHRENLKITVIDIGLQLETDREQLVEALVASSPDEWDEQTVELISKQAVASRNSGVPEKRIFGSDYPFRDVGQLGGLTAVNGANTSLISPAYGGFSNVWGSQIMPFTTAAFESWPVNAAAMRCHYEAILRQIPFAGEEDDLTARLPQQRKPSCEVILFASKRDLAKNRLIVAAHRGSIHRPTFKCCRCKRHNLRAPYIAEAAVRGRNQRSVRTVNRSKAAELAHISEWIV